MPPPPLRVDGPCWVVRDGERVVSTHATEGLAQQEVARLVDEAGQRRADERLPARRHGVEVADVVRMLRR